MIKISRVLPPDCKDTEHKNYKNRDKVVDQDSFYLQHVLRKVKILYITFLCFYISLNNISVLTFFLNFFLSNNMHRLLMIFFCSVTYVYQSQRKEKGHQKMSVA